MTDNKTPSGVIMIMMDKKRHEVATAFDFERQAYSGFKLQRSQEIRCENSLARAVIQRFCADVIADCLSDHHRREIMNALQNQHGYTVRTFRFPEDIKE